MDYKEKKYILLPEQEEFSQIEFDMNCMQPNQTMIKEQNEYEQMHFEVNSIYEEVNNQTYPGYQGNGYVNQNNTNEVTHQTLNRDIQQSVVNQQRYDQIEQMYQQGFQQSYQDGYYQGFQECYGQVYEQAYNQAYQIAYQQAQGQVMTSIGQIEPMIGQVNNVAGQIEPMIGQVNNAVGQIEPMIGQVDSVALKMESMVNEFGTMIQEMEQKINSFTQESQNSNVIKAPVSVEEVLTIVEEALPVEEVKPSINLEQSDEAQIDDIMSQVDKIEVDTQDKEADTVELEKEKIKNELRSIAREEYKEDISHYVGKSSKIYAKKFDTMNETKQVLNFNLPALVLGPIWYAYRKMPLMAFALAITMVLTLSTENGLVGAGVLIVLVGVLSDKIYKTHIDRLLDMKFMKSEKEQLNHQKLRGGVSIVYALTFVIASIGISIYITEVLIYKSDFVRGIFDNLLNLYYQFM